MSWCCAVAVAGCSSSWSSCCGGDNENVTFACAERSVEILLIKRNNGEAKEKNVHSSCTR